MNTLANAKTVLDITIIICFALFLILLIVGVAFSSVFAIASSFIVGAVGYVIVDYSATKEYKPTVKSRLFYCLELSAPNNKQ